MSYRATILCLVGLGAAAAATSAAGATPAPIDPARPVNWSHSLNRGLCLWLIALPDQNRGVIWRDIARRNHATLTNMSPAEDWKAAGRRGGWGALDFDGTNDHARIPIHPSLPTNYPITVSAVIKKRQSNWMGIIQYGAVDIGVGATGYALEISDVDVLEWNNSVSGGTSSATLVNDVPYLVVCSNASAGSRRFYAVNLATGAVAIDETETTTLNIATPAFDMKIGAFQINAGALADFVDGTMDDVRVWNRALSSAELRALAREAMTGYPSTLAWVDRPFHSPEAPAGGSPVPKILQLLSKNRPAEKPFYALAPAP
jgi:hypothetical protein